MNEIKDICLFEKNQKKICFEKKQTKRIVSKKWSFHEECFNHEYQFNMIHNMFKTNMKLENCCENNKVYNTVSREIQKKIYGYKQQDILKKKYDSEKFLTFDNLICKLYQSELKCYYCKENIFVLYDISRESKQWSVDRINNNMGHNNDNYLISCLKCNLKRRCTRDDKFLFTKQMRIFKEQDE